MAQNQIEIGQTVSEDEINAFSGVGQTYTEQQINDLSSSKISDSQFEQLAQSTPVGGTINLNEIKPVGPSEQSSSWLKEYANNAWSSTTRAAGVGMGLLNAPLAMAWGSANAKNVNPEEYAKMPYWKQELVSMRAGLESAWESISEKEKFGTLYGEYYKGTTGKTIDESLPDGLKWTAPTLEFLANLVSDPTVPVSFAKQLATMPTKAGASWAKQAKSFRQLPGFKGYQKSLPEGLIKELEKFDQLQANEKAQLQQRLMKVLQERGDYMKWWQDELAAKDLVESKKGGPLLKPGERAVPDLTAPRNAIAGQPQEGSAILRETAVEAPEQFNKLSGMAESRPRPSITKFKREKAVTKYNKTRTDLGLDPVAIEDVEKAAAIRTQNKIDAINEFRTSKGLEPISANKFKNETGELNIDFEILNKRIRSAAIKLKNGKIYQAATHGEALNKIPMALRKQIEDADGFVRADTNEFVTRDQARRLVGNSLDEIDATEIVNRPITAKSIINNQVGSLNIDPDLLKRNPNLAKVANSIGIRKGEPFSLPTALSKVNQEVFNRFAPLKVSPSTYDEAVKFSAYKDQAWLKFNELKDVFSATKGDEGVVTAYITAHRDFTRAKNGIANPGGVTIDNAANAIGEIEAIYKNSGRDPKILKDTVEAFQAWTHDNILKPALDSGIISQNSYDEIVRKNQWYATFDIIEGLPSDLNKVPSSISGEYFSVTNQKIVQSLKGAKEASKTINPIEATVKKFIDAQAVYARNKVANTFLDDPNILKNFAQPVAKNAKDYKIMKQQGLNPTMAVGNDQGTVSRFKGGVVQKYAVDKDLATAMKQLTPWQAPKAIQAINAIFRKSATTAYLPFTISNAMRDGLMAYNTAPVYTAKDAPKFAKDWAKGLFEGAKHEFFGKSDIAKEYINNGGTFGYVGNLRKPKAATKQLFKKSIPEIALDVVKSPLDLIEKLSATIELAPRLGVYSRAIDEGYGPGVAALMGRRSTIDFNASGRYTKVVNQFVPFLNARVQGRVTVARAVINNPGKTAAKVFISTALPGLAAYAWNRTYYSDLYDDIPEYIKQNYFTIITGTEENEYGKTVPRYFTISKGDLGQMAWNPIEFGLDEKMSNNPQETQKFLVNYLNDLSPVEFAREGEVSGSKLAGGLLPPIVKGAVEDYANRNFYTDKEIEPKWMQEQKPPELRFKDRTPESYKWISKKLSEIDIKISPLRIQNFMSNIFAGYGREGLDPEAMLRGLTGRVVKTTGGAQEDRVWDELNDIKEGYVSTRAYAEQFIESGDRAQGLKLMNEWNQGLNKRIKEHNKEFGKYGLQERGGIRQQFMFSPEKKKNLLMKRKTKEAPIMKRLKRR